jgi:hypothetical protein
MKTKLMLIILFLFGAIGLNAQKQDDDLWQKEGRCDRVHQEKDSGEDADDAHKELPAPPGRFDEDGDNVQDALHQPPEALSALQG